MHVQNIFLYYIFFHFRSKSGEKFPKTSSQALPNTLVTEYPVQKHGKPLSKSAKKALTRTQSQIPYPVGISAAEEAQRQQLTNQLTNQLHPEKMQLQKSKSVPYHMFTNETGYSSDESLRSQENQLHLQLQAGQLGEGFLGRTSYYQNPHNSMVVAMTRSGENGGQKRKVKSKK